MLLLPALLALSGCNSVSVGADNRYGYTRGSAVVNIPIDAISDHVGKVAGATRAEKIQGPFTAQVVSVHDGNTLTVMIDGHNEKVRLIGVDAPELAQAPWGEQARDALTVLVEGKTLRLETDITARDQDKRLLAYIYVGEMFVNREIVRQGQAVIYTVPPNVAHVDEYRKAQAEAREAGRGVWKPAQPLTVAPDCYRKLEKGRAC